MSDNYSATPGSGLTFKSKEISAIQHPGLILYDEGGLAITPTTSGSVKPLAVDSPCFLTAGVSRTSITCTLANTNYVAGATIPAGTVRILVWAVAYDAVLGVEATTVTTGTHLKADTVYELRVATGNTLNAQSPTAGTVVKISYLPS